MKKTIWIILGILAILLVLLVSTFIGTFNNLQMMDENVNAKWAQVENQLKRRNDLIPNLVSTVKGYASHEKEVFSNIAEARSKLGGAINKDNIKDIQQSNNELNSALSRLLLIVERYPELKADKQFINIQDELAGTENRISVARMDYNQSVQALNSRIRLFPTSIIASVIGLKSREYFEINEAEKKVPEVKF